MGITYDDAPVEATAMLHTLIAEYYPPIARLRESLDLQMRWCESDGDDLHPLKVGGYPCAAVVRVVPLRWRAVGGPDVLIEVDAAKWYARNDKQKRALLHHEVHHIELVDLKQTSDGGFVCKLDRLGRPRVTLRPHDWQLGGFRELADVYGEDAPEVIGLRNAVRLLDQGCFDFMRSDDVPSTLAMGEAV